MEEGFTLNTKNGRYHFPNMQKYYKFQLLCKHDNVYNSNDGKMRCMNCYKEIKVKENEK